MVSRMRQFDSDGVPPPAVKIRSLKKKSRSMLGVLVEVHPFRCIDPSTADMVAAIHLVAPV